MSAFNPFDSFFAPDAELNNAVAYLRNCVNTHDTTGFPPETDEPEVRGTPPQGLRHAVKRLRRRITRC